jgi:predicted AAA+ superfamily ATPase
LAVALDLLSRQNPWWADPAAVELDPHLRALDASPLRRPVRLPVSVEQDGIYILRGPRQVGKTTFLKSLLRDLIRKGHAPRALLYADCELLGVRSGPELARLLEAFLRIHPEPGRKLLCLDEVTRLEEWAGGIRALVDLGALEGVTVVATGSHAIDLRRGGERLPGRRGAGADLVLYPMTFRDYVAAHVPGAELPALGGLQPGEVYGACREVALRGLALEALFDRFLGTGGYPRPAAAYAVAGSIPPEVYWTYRDAVLGEVSRARRRETHFRELGEFVLRRLGSTLDWRDVARETDIGSHNTVRQYVEDLEALFLWHVVYRTRTLGDARPALRAPKKVHLDDPFAGHVLRAWIYGFADPWEATLHALADPEWRGRVVESAVVSHLVRRYGPFVHYFGNAHEVDAVVYRELRLEALVEVKYRSKVGTEGRKLLSRLGGGIVVSREELEWDEGSRVAVVPAPHFLAVLAP